MEGLSERENLTASQMPTKILKNIPMVILVVDVLLFTHHVHLPKAYASKPDQWIYALRKFGNISRRLYSSNIVQRTFKIVS